tara:strand:+ start:589 stop:1059 length:471 start_codon:yes stop_codon:yes gene_type:complete
MNKKCELILERDTFTKNTTLGKLYFNGEFLCHTLENSYKNNNRNTSSIPCGLYDVRVRTGAESGNFKYVHLLVEEVPKRSYILFHIGNTHKDTSGCVLTGMDRVGDEMITNSLKAHTLLMNIILNNDLQDDITLVVKNDLNTFDDAEVIIDGTKKN